MYGKILYCPLSFQVTGELLREVFTTSVGLWELYLYAMLSFEPGLIVSVLCECLTFTVNWFNVAPAAVIVSDTNEVFLYIMALGCHWPLHIRMDYFTNAGCMWTSLGTGLCVGFDFTQASQNDNSLFMSRFKHMMAPFLTRPFAVCSEICPIFQWS